MELYIPKGGFRWGGVLALRDGSGKVRYRLMSDAYRLSRRLRLLDLADREAVTVRQQVPALFPRYELEVYGLPVGAVERDLSYAPPRCTLPGLGWAVSGSLGREAYTLLAEDREIAACGADPEDPGRLRLDLPEGPAAMRALGVMLTVHCFLAPGESRLRETES